MATALISSTRIIPFLALLAVIVLASFGAGVVNGNGEQEIYIDATPDNAVNELVPGATHTVDAMVTGSTPGGYFVNFSIVAGPNSGASFSTNTDAAGMASFTYSAVQGPAGLCWAGGSRSTRSSNRLRY